MKDIHRKIGVSLYHGPKTVEELAEDIGEDIKDVMEALKELVEMKLVIKKGYPPKYELAPHIRDAIEVEEIEGLLFHTVVEVSAVDRETLERALKDIVEKMKKEKRMEVRRAEVSSIERGEDGYYYAHIDANIVFYGLEPLVYFIFFYGPSVMELLSTNDMKVTPSDLQGAVNIATTMVQGYVMYITKLMTRKELREFNRELLKTLYGDEGL